MSGASYPRQQVAHSDGCEQEEEGTAHVAHGLGRSEAAENRAPRNGRGGGECVAHGGPGHHARRREGCRKGGRGEEALVPPLGGHDQREGRENQRQHLVPALAQGVAEVQHLGLGLLPLFRGRLGELVGVAQRRHPEVDQQTTARMSSRGMARRASGSRPSTSCRARPRKTEATVMPASAPKVPAKTSERACRVDSMSAMKKVLSPSSEKKMSRREERKPSSQRPSDSSQPPGSASPKLASSAV